MINLIKRWWRPNKFYVSYIKNFGVGCDFYDKYSYNTLEEAQVRFKHLCDLGSEGLLAEGFLFVPNYLRIIQITSPNPIRRFLNKCGSKRTWNIFGFKI
jgi:hypothetical protein